MKSKVYLVGAGPGDPELLTQKAHALIASADVIIYDALIPPSILQYASATAQKVFVGKRAGKHSKKQEEINRIIVETAQKNSGTIIRLKGGDPFVFGRGAEEMIALKNAGIDYEIIPGITAGIAAPSYCGIPVTHRGVSQMVSFITGTSKEGELPDLNWNALAQMKQTLVFYMSMRSVPQIAQVLQKNGMDASQQAAIISHGTLPTQQIFSGSLAYWEKVSIDYDQLSPGLFVVGDVVSFAETYGWKKTLPLAGKRIVVTRSFNQSSSLLDLLRHEGAEAVLLPTIEIIPSNDLSELQRAIEEIDSFDWIVFPSTNAVEIFFKSCFVQSVDARKLSHCRIGAVGKATAHKLQEYGIIPDFIPQKHTGKDLALELIESYPISERKKILIPSSSIAHTDMSLLLESAGGECHPVTVYENRIIDYSEEYLREMLSEKTEWITFCSSSSVTHFMELIEQYHLRELITNIRFAVIGEITKQTLESYQLHAQAQPQQPSMPLLVASIIQQTH